jgi:LmbE family N-acetylglucosaminyl deacetylase
MSDISTKSIEDLQPQNLFNGQQNPLVVIMAHPDDEVIALGAQLPRLQKATIVHVTDGAPRNELDSKAAGFETRAEYARARRVELYAALGIAGISPLQTSSLDIVDQEASFNLHELTLKISELFRKLKPRITITHPYEGGHPDHDATAFAVHAACELLKSQNEPAPFIVEGSFYHGKGGQMNLLEFVPSNDCRVMLIHLNQQEQKLKQKMIDCFQTQKNILRLFPIDLEKFRFAPHYEFATPPHQGKLFYENFDWGMTGQQWRTLARYALEKFNLKGLM